MLDEKAIIKEVGRKIRNRMIGQDISLEDKARSLVMSPQELKYILDGNVSSIDSIRSLGIKEGFKLKFTIEWDTPIEPK